MPGFNGKGPMGEGPRTGRGSGFCVSGIQPVYGRGRGGVPYGCGRGGSLRQGLKFGLNNSNPERIEFLRQQKKDIEDRIALLENNLKNDEQ